eukprot:g11796.t2
MSKAFDPADDMRPPTPVVVQVVTVNTVPAASGCCNCLPANARPDVQAVHCISIAILTIHIIASVVLYHLLVFEERSALYCFSVFPAVITSGVVIGSPGNTKFFYVTIAFPYLIAGISDIIVCVVMWVVDAYLPQQLNIIFGSVALMGAVCTLLGAGMAFKTACKWDEAGTGPAAEASPVLPTEAHVV